MGEAVPGSSVTYSENDVEEVTSCVCPDSQWFYCTEQLLIKNWKTFISKLRVQGIQNKLLFISYTLIS